MRTMTSDGLIARYAPPATLVIRASSLLSAFQGAPGCFRYIGAVFLLSDSRETSFFVGHCLPPL